MDIFHKLAALWIVLSFGVPLFTSVKLYQATIEKPKDKKKENRRSIIFAFSTLTPVIVTVLLLLTRSA